MNYNWIWNIKNSVIQEAVPRTAREISTHDNIACSVSGGSDSDIMIDIISRFDENKKVHYVFFDTGIEMQATKKHLNFLEEKYGINIEIVRPKIPVAVAVKKFGYPFISKNISESIARLQRNGFTWTDEPFDVLYNKFPKCKSALKWWCNEWGENSSFNINRQPYLKEFMIANPPTVKISQKCCQCSKKEPANTYRKNNDIDLMILGIRKAEGGARSAAYKSCMNDGIYGLQHFPLFWFKDADKKIYETFFNVRHSAAYEEYGCKRTGCAGCPFGSKFEDELKMLEKYEPQLYKAVCNIFGPSYEYTRAYRDFKAKKNLKNSYIQLELEEVKK